MSLYEIKLELLKLLVGGPFNSDAYKAVQAAVDIIFFPWSLIEDKQPTEVKKYLVTKTLTNKEGESYNIVEFERWDGEKFIYYDGLRWNQDKKVIAWMDIKPYEKDEEE